MLFSLYMCTPVSLHLGWTFCNSITIILLPDTTNYKKHNWTLQNVFWHHLLLWNTYYERLYSYQNVHFFVSWLNLLICSGWLKWFNEMLFFPLKNNYNLYVKNVITLSEIYENIKLKIFFEKHPHCSLLSIMHLSAFSTSLAKTSYL